MRVKRRLFFTALISVCLICATAVGVLGATSTSDQTIYAGGSVFTGHGSVTCDEGIAWDYCAAEFYIKDPDDLTPDQESDLLNSTMIITVTKGTGAVLHASAFQDDDPKPVEDDNEFHYSSNWCYLSYGTRMEVSTSYQYYTHSGEVTANWVRIWRTEY